MRIDLSTSIDNILYDAYMDSDDIDDVINAAAAELVQWGKTHGGSVDPDTATMIMDKYNLDIDEYWDTVQEKAMRLY